jgi:hypothetical protein
MKRNSLISLAVIAVLSSACSSQSDQSPPESTPQASPRKSVSQALEGANLVEIPVSPAVQAAVGNQATVRAFQIQASGGVSVSVATVMPSALHRAASDLTKDWRADPERNAEDTRTALKYLEGVVQAIEAEVGTGEAFSSGYYHSWENMAFDRCHHRDFYGLVFPQAGKVFTLEARGDTDC